MKDKILARFLIGAIIVTSLALTIEGKTENDWPMFRHDPELMTDMSIV
ncbi:MAG: hypothetical protein HXS40_04795 [Theionarchaea archaeon]|nr:hypothetical protein [Theionarchaea archaeon]